MSQDIFLILIRAGRVYSARDMQGMARTLSLRFRGEIWARGPKSFSAQEGRFGISIMGTGAGRYVDFARQCMWVLRRCLALRKVEHASVVIGSYDPFREGLLARLASLLLGAPYWIELNGCYSDDNNYRDGPEERPNLRKKWLMKQVARLTTSGAAAIKTLFPGQAEEFLPSTDPRKTMAFPDFVDLDGFHFIEEQKFVLFLGFPFFLKGVDILLTSFLAVAKEFPEWRLLLVGHELEAHCGKWLPHPQVELRRAVYREDVPGIMGRSAIVVLPSRTEAMGRVLIEAAACSKARIASRVGGTNTVIAHMKDGILVEPVNDLQLANALRLLMSDARLRRQFGDAAKQRVDQEFTSKTWLDRTYELAVRCMSGMTGQPDKREGV